MLSYVCVWEDRTLAAQWFSLHKFSLACENKFLLGLGYWFDLLSDLLPSLSSVPVYPICSESQTLSVEKLGQLCLQPEATGPGGKWPTKHCSPSGSRELLRLVVNYQLGCKLFAFGGGLCVSMRFKTKQSKTRQIVSLHPKLLISSHVLKPCWTQSLQFSFHKKKSRDQPA